MFANDHHLLEALSCALHMADDKDFVCRVPDGGHTRIRVGIVCRLFIVCLLSGVRHKIRLLCARQKRHMTNLDFPTVPAGIAIQMGCPPRLDPSTKKHDPMNFGPARHEMCNGLCRVGPRYDMKMSSCAGPTC